jgi:hypothetical protein
MSATFVAPRVQHGLAAVYRFYDAFLFPPDERTPALAAALDVSIPTLGWSALRIANDLTYRFSASTVARPMPTGVNLAVTVTAANGNYVSLEPILLTLPLPVSSPPLRSDFLISLPLWPTTAFRPPEGETVVRGSIKSATAQPVSDLKVEMWLGGAATPPPGTQFTRSNGDGDFLFRLPQLRGVPGTTTTVGIQLNDGAVSVTPVAPTVVLGQSQVIAFQRL